jgi:hypothetical protein
LTGLLNDLWERVARVSQYCDLMLSGPSQPSLAERSWTACARRRDDPSRCIEARGRTMIEALSALVTAAEAHGFERP